MRPLTRGLAGCRGDFCLLPAKLARALQARGQTRCCATTPVPEKVQDRKAARSNVGGIGEGGAVDLQPPRGTRDFYPEDLRFRNWLFGEFAAVSRLFGFEQYDSPVLESEALFVRKAGEEIRDQLFNFEDKGGRAMALRPELTPSLARMVLAKAGSVPLPAKWWAVGQCWRYERMTRGRRREHYQWNMDIVGVAGVEAEAELLSAITTFFARVGLTSQDILVRVSNRKVLQAIMTQHGVPDTDFSAVCVVVDKIDKLPRDAVCAELAALGLGESAIEGLLSAMQIRDIADLSALLGADSPAVQELSKLFELARGYGYSEWLQFDVSVVRGLAYYTGTVFEAFDRGGQLRAICGGGRYDRLLSTFGGADTPMVGFGFGDAVIVELLKDKGLVPVTPRDVQDVIFVFDEDLRCEAGGVAARLRAAGRRVDVVLESGKKMKWAFKHAERLAAERLVLVGRREWDAGCVRVKVLATREESDVAITDLQ